MAREAWISDESRMVSVAAQALSRARRRPFAVLSVALIATAAYVVIRGYQAPSCEAALYFRLAESELGEPGHAPRPPRAIREYVASVALSRSRLEPIMKKYDVSSAYLARDREAAIEDFRQDIEVDVNHNYFIQDRSLREEPRSAQVTISLSGSDPEHTRAILHEIGDAVLKEQAGRRAGRLAQESRLLEPQVALVRAHTRSLQEGIDRLWLELAKADAPHAIEIRAQIAALQAEARGALEQTLALERNAADLNFSAAGENQNLWLNFQLFDESLRVFSPHLSPRRLAVRAVLFFVVALLLTLPVLGAFDDRIYTPGELTVRGLPLLGTLPRFPGDDAGSFRTRVRTGRV